MTGSEWWRHVRDVWERDYDERARMVRLVAARDATLALLALLLALAVLDSNAGALSTTAPAGAQILLLVLFVWGIVFTTSLTLRGGNASRQRATYQAVSYVVGTVALVAIMGLLVRVRIIPPRVLPSDVPIFLVGTALAALIWVGLSRRNR